MFEFDEYDQIRITEQAGFDEIHLELQVGIQPYPVRQPFEALLRTVPNPTLPTAAEAIQAA
jgi:hypothetical protein